MHTNKEAIAIDKEIINNSRKKIEKQNISYSTN